MKSAESLSIIKAASELYMTRQAVSKQVRKLEEDLGELLFERDGNVLSLTQAGKIYHDYFSGVISGFQDARRRVNDLGNPGGSVTVGYFSRAEIDTEIANVIREMRLEDESLKFTWERHDPRELISRLLSHQLDIIVTYNMDPIDSLENIEVLQLTTARDLLIISNKHPKFREDAVYTDFQDETFLAWQYKDESIYKTKAAVMEHAKRNGLDIHNIEIYPNASSSDSAILMGMGVAICGEINSVCKLPGIVSFPLKESAPVICVWRSGDQNAVICKFAERLKTAINISTL